MYITPEAITYANKLYEAQEGGIEISDNQTALLKKLLKI